LNTYPWYLRLFFWNQRRRYGAVLAPALLWARVPRLLLAVALFYGAIERRTSPLRRVLRLLVMVRVSQLNGCSFCVDLNTATLIGCGVALQKAQARDHFDEQMTMELTALIAFQNMSSKFNSALDVPSQGFCELPSGTTIPTHP
jgi:AhpD family alkylhydroperoxidase